MRTTAICLALMAGTALAAPAAAETPFTIEDVAKIRHVGAIAMSPDGSHVAYSLSRTRDILAGEENGTARSEIRIATGAGENRLYVPENMGAYALDWKDETTLTFLARGADDDKTSLYAINIAGGAPEKLFSWKESIRAYDFADDGDVLFFSAREASDPKTAKLEKKGFDANIIDEQFTFTKLYRHDMTDAETTDLELEGQVSFFDASEDGERVVVALADTPLVGDDIINKTFHIVDGDDGDVQSVIETEGKIGNAAFSPDGRRIAFRAGVDRSDPIANSLAIANARNGEFNFIRRDGESDQMAFQWLNNGSLKVMAHRSTASETYTMTLDGQVSNVEVHEGYVMRSMSAAAGNYAAVADAPTHPRALFVSRNGGAPTKWTDHNSWLDDTTLGNQEVFTWTARDGVQVDGLLVTPKGRAPRGGWPMITLVHGGPEAHYSNGWITRYSDPGQFGASMGYAVFYPNYRGSTGRGVDFAKLDHVDAPA
ncbi:MAG: hypothetical protein AAGA69_05250, partial [Pseudomonadota bacterium]